MHKRYKKTPIYGLGSPDPIVFMNIPEELKPIDNQDREEKKMTLWQRFRKLFNRKYDGKCAIAPKKTVVDPVSENWKRILDATQSDDLSKIQFTTVSPPDAKVFLVDKQGNWQFIPEVQSLHYTHEYVSPENETGEGIINGTIYAVCFHKEPFDPQQVSNIEMQVCSEFGPVMDFVFSDVVFSSQTYGISVDDIITEFVYTFTAKTLKIESHS